MLISASPEDFTALDSSLVQFMVGSATGSPATFNVNIQPDLILEGDQVFTVELDSAPDQYTIGDVSSTEVTIIDDDGILFITVLLCV